MTLQCHCTYLNETTSTEGTLTALTEASPLSTFHARIIFCMAYHRNVSVLVCVCACVCKRIPVANLTMYAQEEESIHNGESISNGKFPGTCQSYYYL